ncbi:MAG: hypothetical protein WCJ95_21100 [Mariniphaga sp.]
MKNQNNTVNISYLASAAAVIFDGYLCALAVFRLDGKSPPIRTRV